MEEILNMTQELLYQYKTDDNRLGIVHFNEMYYKGLMLVDGKTLNGYVIVYGRRITSLYAPNKNKERLIRLAIDKFGANEIYVSSEKMANLCREIGFKQIYQDKHKMVFKLYGEIIRKNNFENLVVKRQNETDNLDNGRFIYYFYDKMNQIGKLKLDLNEKKILEIETYYPYNDDSHMQQLLRYACDEKGCNSVREIYTNKDKIEAYEKFGFDLTRKVKNKTGMYYIMTLVSREHFDEPKKLMKWMKDNIQYSEFMTLMSPIEVEKGLSGSSHDQANFIMYKLKQFKPHRIFVAEYKDGEPNKYGKTATCVFYPDKNEGLYWIENVLDNKINGPYTDINELKEAIEKKWEFTSGNNSLFMKQMQFKPVSGCTLQEYINIAKKEK